MAKTSDRTDAIRIRELLTHQDESYLEMGGMLLESMDEEGVVDYLIKDISIFAGGFNLPNTFKGAWNKLAVKELLLGVISEFTAQSDVVSGKCAELQILDVAYLENAVRLEGLSGLRSLRIFNMPTEYELFSLEQLVQLEILELYTAPVLCDLSALADAPSIRTLVLCNLAELKNIEVLANNTSIEKLVIVSCPKIESFAPLASMSALKHLQLPGVSRDKIPESLHSGLDRE